MPEMEAIEELEQSGDVAMITRRRVSGFLLLHSWSRCSTFCERDREREIVCELELKVCTCAAGSELSVGGVGHASHIDWSVFFVY